MEVNSISSDDSCSINQTIFQGFEWYCPPDNKHWQRLAEAVPSLASLGVTTLWIPPATKSIWRDENGYAPYDLYDLGEFDQKFTTCTKWGSKEDLVKFVETANSYGIAVIFDAVLNHKAGADYKEVVKAVKVDPYGNEFAEGISRAQFSVANAEDRSKESYRRTGTHRSLDWL